MTWMPAIAAALAMFITIAFSLTVIQAVGVAVAIGIVVGSVDWWQSYDH